MTEAHHPRVPQPYADRYGLPLSTGSTIAVERYVEGVDRLLAYGLDADACFKGAIEADEGFALAHAGVALFLHFQGQGKEARAAIERARALVGGTTRREQGHVHTLAAAITGDARALDRMREHLAEFPRDTLVAAQASSAIGFSGRPDRDEERLALLDGLAPAYGDDWWFLGAHGFVYHELRRFEESRHVSERSLALYPANANASHNIAHVHFETVANADGAVFLRGWLAGYDRRAPYHCHLSWHLALFELAAGRYSRAVEIYQRDILDSANPRLTLYDGAALLWRLSAYGCAEGPLPWGPLRDTAARVSRPGFIFGDVHAAFAYAGARDESALSGLIDGLRDLDARGHPTAGSVALPLVHGIAAFAAGDYAAAIRHIAPLDGQFIRVGGSHAQWEVFEETLVECYLRAGRPAEAEMLLRRRLARRSSPRDLFSLARAQSTCGDTASAAASLTAARHLWTAAEPDNAEQVGVSALEQQLAGRR